MSTIQSSKYQYRTLETLYLFKLKGNDNLTIKILDHSQKCLFKQTIPSKTFSSMVIQGHFETVLEQLVEQKFLPREHLPSSLNQDKEQNCEKALEHAIEKTKPLLFAEHKDIERYCCPITLDIFQDPVIDEEGHTFEKAAIEKHLKIKNECPLGREPIYSLAPNRLVKETLEEWKKQDPIPTFGHFQKENSRLAETNLQMAQTYTDEGEYQEALEFYAKAFQYTNDWTHYKNLPLLFEKMEEPEKAHLATLYLAYYQFKAKNYQEAIQTLEQSNKNNKLHPNLILIELYHLTEETQKALKLSIETAQSLSNEHPDQAIRLYKRILREHPTEITLYSLLAALVPDPQIKAHVLLKGALHALQTHNYQAAEQLTQEARAVSQDSFIDEQVTLALMQKQQKTPHLKEHLQNIAEGFEKRNNTYAALQAYKRLFHLENTPSNCQKTVAAYTKLQNAPKELAWSLTYLNLLIQNKEWEQAEKIAQVLLQKGQPKIPLYEKLEEVYSNWHGHELENLWKKLGKVYQESDQLASAEKTYRKAYERFQGFEQALQLAEVLNQTGKTPESVRIYYDASLQALLEQNTERLGLTTREIQKIDPRMKFLSETQKTTLLMQTQILKLQAENQQLSEKLQGAYQKIESLEKVVQSLKDKAFLKEQRKKAEEQEMVRLAELEMKRQEELSQVWFGKAKWAQYFGDVGIEPPLPPTIRKILDAPCPIWPGKKVQETHLLTLIPATVNGKPLTLQSLGELVQKPLQGPATKYGIFGLSQYTDRPTPASYWTLISRDLIPKSRNTSYTDQQQLVKQYPGYEVPHILDATVSIFMEHVQSGTRLYLDNPPTYTRCQEKYNAYNQLVVGGFAVGRLHVHNDVVAFDRGHETSGVGVQRKFS